MDDISEKTIRAAAGLYGIVHVRHLLSFERRI